MNSLISIFLYRFVEVSSNYDVTFPTRLATSSSSVTNIPDLRAFTVAFWLRTTDEENPGTPISYSTKVNGKLIDNALVLQDYGAFALHINNEKQFIGVSSDDGHWHHVAVTWRNTDGRWIFYLDGKIAKRYVTLGYLCYNIMVYNYSKMFGA